MHENKKQRIPYGSHFINSFQLITAFGQTRHFKFWPKWSCCIRCINNDYCIHFGAAFI